MTAFWFVTAPLVSHTDWGGMLKTALALKAQADTMSPGSARRGWAMR